MVKEKLFEKAIKGVLLGAVLVGVCMVRCSCSGVVSEKTENLGVMFFGDDVHYALLQYYEKSTSGTSLDHYNGEILEKKWSVYIKNIDSDESALVFETNDGEPLLFCNLKDTALCVYYDTSLSIINNTGKIQEIKNPQMPGHIYGWLKPYSEIVSIHNSNQMFLKNILTGLDSLIDSAIYCNAQIFGIIYYWGGKNVLLNGIKKRYSSIWNYEYWINDQEIVGIAPNSNEYIVGKYNVNTGISDTLYNLTADVPFAINNSATAIIYLTGGGNVNIVKL